MFARSLALTLLALPLFGGQALLRDAAETNVNQRYVVESVSLAGVELHQVGESNLPKTLREQLFALIGRHCDAAALESLATEIRRQLHVREVSQHLSKGSAPELVRVNFDVVRKDVSFDVSLPRFLYHSQQGFSGEVEATARVKDNSLTFGVVSNGDDLTERYSGIEAHFRSAGIGSDRIHANVIFEDYHELWSNSTIGALEAAGPQLYRARWNVAPEISFDILPGVAISTGVSLQDVQPETAHAEDRAANAATFDIRARRHNLEARYNLRVATKVLGSTYAYARHLVTLRYQARVGRQTFTDEAIAGSIVGDAPFFERFVLGSSSTLRGWDRYQIDPLGGSRVVHNEISYSYRVGEGSVEGFYDTGALWQSDRAAQLRHSLGVGYRQGVFVMTVAFPVLSGRVEPVFMAGMNY